jgi:hypothetical protein
LSPVSQLSATEIFNKVSKIKNLNLNLSKT